jgi:LDH2 family malate/lactate/ureidoglycolate dehydrogenase
MPTYPAEKFRALGIKMFNTVGATKEQAETVTDILVDTSLFGIDSHGVRALPGHVRNLKKGRIRPDAEITVLKDTLTTAFGWVSTVSEHIGALYYYSLMAAKQGMIGIVTCKTTAHRTTPYGGREGRFGTNPLSICIPAEKENPILLDMATSIVASGHLAVMAARGEKVPEGWLIDKDGNPTTDPSDYFKGGFMVPFGTYKGYGLSIIISALPMFIPEEIGDLTNPTRWGHTFMALDPEGFMPLQTFKERTDALIQYIKSCPPLPGKEVLMPFEREWRVREQRTKEGIFIDEQFWTNFVEVGQEIGIDVEDELKD